MCAQDRVAAAEGQFVRFDLGQRIEHSLLMLSFSALVLTGLPQKLHGSPWASWLVLSLGGIDSVRLAHRVFAMLLVAESVYHLGYVVVGLWRRRLEPSMVPAWKDVRDAWQMLQYCLGLAHKEPAFGRFDYRQKFEYWGVVLGAAIMIVSGAILWLPTYATRFFPGEIVPAAKEAHSSEALLAFLVIVIWHLYGVHLSPLRFPGDLSIFTGRISQRRMAEEHGLEYARYLAKTAPRMLTEELLMPVAVTEDSVVVAEGVATQPLIGEDGEGGP